MKIIVAVIVSVVILSVVVVGGVAVMSPVAGAGATGGTEVRLHTMQPGQLIESINAEGVVEPRTKVSISARISARIVELPYAEGQRVTAGDSNVAPPAGPSVLVKLDDTDLKARLRATIARRDAQTVQIKVTQAQLEAERARLEGVRARLAEAERHFKRQSALHEAGDVSQSVYDQANSAYIDLKSSHDSAINSLESNTLSIQVIRHNLEAADAEIARAEDDLSYTTITSPIDGVITRLNAEVGELVITGTMNNPGTVILEVADLSTMMFIASVNEADIGSVRKGQKVQTRLRAYPDRIFEATVDSIALVPINVSGGAVYYKVETLMTTHGESVLSGLSGDAAIETNRHENVLTVPSQAVMSRPVDDLPLAIRKDNPNVDMTKTTAAVVYRMVDAKAVVTPVTIGASDATHTIILSGLDETDRVVVGPYKVLENIAHDQRIRDEEEAAQKDDQSSPPDKGEADSAPDESDRSPTPDVIEPGEA